MFYKPAATESTQETVEHVMRRRTTSQEVTTALALPERTQLLVGFQRDAASLQLSGGGGVPGFMLRLPLVPLSMTKHLFVSTDRNSRGTCRSGFNEVNRRKNNTG